MSEHLLEQVKSHRREIKHEVLTYAVSELVSMYRADPKEVQIQPEWQRLFRWSRDQQSAFIESLILEIPIPPLFFFEAEDGTWELLDGLQRFSTILKFMGSSRDVAPKYQGIDGNEDEWHYTTQGDINEPLQLYGGEYLTSLNGLTYVRLPQSLRLNLKRARLQIYVLKRETDRMYKYEVFKRLNRGGALLAEQELRNSAIRILDDKFPDFIKKLGSNKDFRRALNIKPKNLAKGYADELALRFLTMKNYGGRFRHDVAPLLTTYMEQVASSKVQFDYGQEETLFGDIRKTIADAAADGNLFRHNRKGRSWGGFSPTLFELVSLAAANSLSKIKPLNKTEQIKEFRTLLSKAKNRGYTGGGSNSKKKTKGRLDMAKSWSPGSSS